MTRFFSLLVLVFAANPTSGQILGRFYYNAYWELTKPDSAVFFRMCVFDTTRQAFVGPVQDFTKAGRPLMKGAYKNGMKGGEFIFYYASGQVESAGTYTENRRTGRWKYFYANGSPKQEIEFFSTVSDAETPKIIFYNDSTGNRLLENGNGKWAEEYLLLAGHQYDRVSTEGQYVADERSGEWIGKVNGKYLYKETYDRGVFQGGYLLNEGGGKTRKYLSPYNNKLPQPARFAVMEKFVIAKNVARSSYPFLKAMATETEDNSVHTFAEKAPEFTGGMNAMIEFIKKNYKMHDPNVEGKVFISFVVEKNGFLSDVEIFHGKGLTKKQNDEAIRVVKLMPAWIPGFQNGKPVRVKFILPINVRN